MDLLNVCVMSLSLWAQAAGGQAQAPPPPPPPSFQGSAEFSFVGTSGNSDTRSLGAGLTLTFRPHDWTITSKSSFVRSEDSGVTKAQSAVVSTQANRNLSPKVAVFGQHQYLKNRFAGINHRNTIEGGLTFAAVSTTRQTLTLKAGAGYANEQRLTGPNLSTAIATSSAAYKLSWSETATIEDELEAVTSLSQGRDQRLTNTGSLTAKLTTTFSLKVKHTTRWVRSPVPGFKRTDTTTAVALVAVF